MSEKPAGSVQNIAVVGAGVAGLTAAYYLSRHHRVTIYERNGYLGGHTNTIEIPDGPDAGTPVDTGFIVMNHRNYPVLTRLFEDLDVGLRDSDMSFGYRCEETGLAYAGTSLNTLFAQRSNLLRPSYYGMIRDILRFYRQSNHDLSQNSVGDRSLGDYLVDGGYGNLFVHHHLLPMGAAIWSTPCDQMMDFPARSFLHFLRNHGLLSVGDRPQWRTVVGGSFAYVKRMMTDFAGTAHTNTPVQQVKRTNDGVALTLQGGETVTHDAVVLATHADITRKLLADPSEAEASLLAPWEYSVNRTILHWDERVLPQNKRARASWNYCRETGTEEAVSVTYDMNRLQGLNTRRHYLVSLNRKAPIRDETIVYQVDYTHPTYTLASMGTQERLPGLNGKRNTWFCGSYFGYGFHEDAAHSASLVLKDFGIAI